MLLQIENPVVVGKVEQLAKSLGLSKTAVIERALDRLINEEANATDRSEMMDALIAQLDRIPDRADAANPLEWDGHGLPE
jgi:antitoxin VapB